MTGERAGVRRLREPSKLLKGDWNLLVSPSGKLVWVCSSQNGIVRELEHSIRQQCEVQSKAKCDAVAQCVRSVRLPLTADPLADHTRRAASARKTAQGCFPYVALPTGSIPVPAQGSNRWPRRTSGVVEETVNRATPRPTLVGADPPNASCGPCR